MLTKLMSSLLDLLSSKHWLPVFHSGGMIMRRRIDGRWEYRSPTAAEMDDINYNQAIK